MEKIIVFNDYANTQRGFRNFGIRPDFADVLDYLAEGRFLVEAHAYLPIDPRHPHGRDDTHPFCAGGVAFSGLDDEDERGFRHWLAETFDGIHYASIVLSRGDYSARYWRRPSGG